MVKKTKNPLVDLEFIDSISNNPNKHNLEVQFTITNQEKKRPVIIIPGLLGSQLIDKTTKKIIWEPTISGMLFSILFGINTKMKHDQNSVNNILADRISHKYSKLINYLISLGYSQNSDQQTLFTLPYDWRNSNMTSANRKLKNIIQKIKKLGFEQVDIIAHSMGGILARYFIEKVDRENSVNRLITLGTPHYGAPSTYAFLKTGLLRQNVLKKFNWKINVEKFRNIALDYPSIYELLPDTSYLEKLSILGNIVNNDDLEKHTLDYIDSPQKMVY